MATTRDKATVRMRGSMAVMDLPANIDLSAEQPLNEAYAEAAALGTTSLLLNFAAVEYMSSSGIAVIVGLLARARKERRTVSACALSDHYREIFEITRLADFMPIYVDEHSAQPSGEGEQR
jgi:anti-anti-sigma factor